MESLSKKWEDVKRTNLEYYIANINLECWVLLGNISLSIDAKNIDYISIYLLPLYHHLFKDLVYYNVISCQHGFQTSLRYGNLRCNN